MITKTCVVCNTPFETIRNKRRYCSKRCAGTVNGTLPRKHPPRTKVKKCICEWCKQEFETWMCRPGRFCSDQCRSEFGARQPKKKDRSRYKIIICEICGNEKEVHECQDRNGRRARYCSKECAYKGHSLNKMGAGNPNWIEDRNQLAPIERGHNWSNQRKQAIKRDGYRCQICGKKRSKGKRKSIDVHHIKPYRLFNGDYLKANQLSNLITLCRQCHSAVEDGMIPCPQKLF